MAEEHKSRAQRRREEKEKRKLADSLEKKLGGHVTQEQIDKFFEERATAEAMFQEGMKKFEDDCVARYQRQYDNRIAALEKQARIDTERFEDKIRREYDKRMERPKTELSAEVVGDLMAMTFWTLRDYFDFQNEDLHKFNLQMMRLRESMAEHDKLGCITINDIIRQMAQEGYDMQDDLVLVDEMVDAEMANFHREDYAPKGSILNVWHDDEDERLKRLIIEQNREYPEIALVLGRTESACKSRARKLFGTQVLERIKAGA